MAHPVPRLRLTAAGAALLALALVAGAGSAGAVAPPRFDARAAPSLTPDEGRYLEALFDLTDEVGRLHARLGRWEATGGREGLHPADHLDRLGAVRSRLASIPVPARLRSVHARVGEALALQHRFVADWRDAVARGRSFVSQRTDEFAYHEALHRSQRMLLQAYAELRAVLPQAGEEAERAFRLHLRAADLR